MYRSSIILDSQFASGSTTLPMKSMELVREDAGTYGLGVEYAKAMLGEHAREG